MKHNQGKNVGRKRYGNSKEFGRKDAACPKPWKVKYAIALEAELAAQRIKRDEGGVKAEKYPCVCGWWHLSTHRTGKRRYYVDLNGDMFTIRKERKSNADISSDGILGEGKEAIPGEG